MKREEEKREGERLGGREEERRGKALDIPIRNLSYRESILKKIKDAKVHRAPD